MASTLLNQCNPRLIQVEDSCGCNVTRASIKAMTPDDFENLFWKEVGMSRVVAEAKEARMTGVPQSAWMDLFLSIMKPIRQMPLTDQGSVIAPWIYVPQRHRVNANFFSVTAGAVHPAAGVGSIPQSAWKLTIENEGSPWASPLVSLENYFLPGRYLVVIYKNQLTGAGHTVQFKILSAENGNLGDTQRAYVYVQPNVTDSAWSGFDAGEKLVYQPEHGMVLPLANSISNKESWCYQTPSVNTNKLKAFWVQTIRETHCYNEQYLLGINAALTDPLFRKFRTLPLAEQKRQQAAEAERAFWNTVWFGQAINENQTVATYEDLPGVYDPTNPSCLLEYKANTLGIETQLSECGRVVDYAGAALALDVIREALYTLKRTRSAGGASIQRIEAWTDRFTANNILTLMIQYYKDKYSFDTTRYYQPNQKLQFDGQVLWNYNVYEFPEETVELAVISDPFFDDYLGAMPTDDQSMARYFMMPDFSDIWIGLGAARSVARQTNTADNLYNCVIDPTIQHYQLSSKTICVGMDDPNRSLIHKNFSDECPTITTSKCTPGVS